MDLPEPAATSRYSLLLNVGHVFYLVGDFDASLDAFERAKPYAPKSPELQVVDGTIPTGIERVQSAARNHKAITPVEVVTGDARTTTLLQLADLSFAAGEYQRSRALCNRLLNKPFQITPVQKSWAFLRRGRAEFCLGSDICPSVDAKDDYLAAVKVAPQVPWAHYCLLLTANIEFNNDHDAEAAIALYKRIIKEYPKDPETPRAAYYLGLMNELRGQPGEALAAYRSFLEQYPTSPFASAVQTQHIPKLEKLLQEMHSKKNP